MEPRFALLYSPLQFAPQDSVKPDGSLSLPYIASALYNAGFEVKIVDTCVGTQQDQVKDTIFNPTPLPSGLVRVGMSEERISQEIQGFNVIGISSIFTSQTTLVLDLVRLVKRVNPTALIVSGGVNARYLSDRFFDAGVDLICMSEAEDTIVDIATRLRTGEDWVDVSGIRFRRNGSTVTNPRGEVPRDLDTLPIPAWDLLPLDKYWEISRPHGGDFKPGQTIRYASMMTSRGCPFSCAYCHVSKQSEGSPEGNIGGLRFKSQDRVMQEIEILKNLGTEYVFIEDDSLLAKKDRAVQMFRELQGKGLKIIDVNGVNIVHLYKKSGRNGGVVPDWVLLSDMRTAGFEKLSLPFESGSQRILDKYASKKWMIDKLDTDSLVESVARAGITPLGNYTIGYPDETFDEMMATLTMAKRHMDHGLAVASFFVIVPFPGTTLFDQVIKSGQLTPDFNPDDMRWTRSILTGTPVSADALEHIRQVAWKLVNKTEFVKHKESTGFKSLPVVA